MTAGDNVVVSSRNEDRVKEVIATLRGEFGSQRVTGIACNVCKANEVAALVERAKADLGTVDIWINNAGSNAYSFKPLIDSSESDLVDIVDTNVLGTMICCQAAIKLMREQPRGGHIFNMQGAGSDGSPTPRFAAYGATKRALTQFGKSLQVCPLRAVAVGSPSTHAASKSCQINLVSASALNLCMRFDLQLHKDSLCHLCAVSS